MKKRGFFFQRSECFWGLHELGETEVVLLQVWELEVL